MASFQAPPFYPISVPETSECQGRKARWSCHVGSPSFLQHTASPLSAVSVGLVGGGIALVFAVYYLVVVSGALRVREEEVVWAASLVA